MKKKLLLISLLFIAAVSAQAQTNVPCCPDFIIDNLTGIGKECCMSCDTSLTAGGTNGGAGGGGSSPCRNDPMPVCKNSYGQFIVYPNLPGFTYQWTITGGTPATIANGNPVTIHWGNGTTGSITVIITGNGCTKTITRSLCMMDKPMANFTYSPLTNICTGTWITFTNSSAGGSTYTWYFGDGTSSQLANPPQHQYSSAGTYTVTLVVSSASGGSNPNFPPGPGCGCVDSVKKIIVVGNGPGITTCNKMLCPKDTAIYCSTTTCSTYSWAITGGTIIGPANQNCVKVIWNTAPGSLTLTTTGCGACNTNTIIPNVIWPVLPYTGPTTVCVGSTNTYSVPTIPGTFYSWSISPATATILNGGAYPNNFPVNNPVVNVNFLQPGTYTLTCNYNNPNTPKNCGGTTNITITVKPKLSISGNTTFCQNMPGFFTTNNGSVAQWTITGQPGGFSPATFPNAPAISVTWLLPGNYTLTAVPVIPGNYCNPTGVTIAIVVNPSPILSFVTPQTVVCANALTNYTVTSNVTGPVTWSFAAGTGTINPYGTNNTSASVQFTGSGPWALQVSQTANGCTGVATANITQVPLPPVPTITPSGSICSGQTVTVSVTGSVPPGGYIWSATPGAVYVSGQGTTSATFVINSNATISISNCSGTSSVNATVSAPTVTATAVTGTCSAVITASAGAISYSWFLNGSPVGTGNPITVYQNGTYVLQATFAGGCIATFQVTVTGITPVVAIITASGNLCNGGSVTLQAVTQGNCPGAVFTWSNGGSGTTHVVTTPGTYFVTVTCGGCTVVSNAIQVYPCPTGGSGGNCINDLTISHSPCNNPMTFTATGSSCTGPYTWIFGDGYSNNTGIHTYTNIGNYTVFVSQACTNGTLHCGMAAVQIPFVDSFTHVMSCGVNGWTVQLQDASLSLIGFGYTPSWSATCGSFNANNIPNPVLTIPFGCNPVITLTITIGGCTYTKSYTYNLPSTPLSINVPPVICKGQNNTYSSSFTTGVISYNWNFGDATTGTTNPINHAYDGTVPNPTIILTIKDQYGCIFTKTQAITVIIPPALTISPSPIVKLCPNCQPPVTLTTSPLTGFSGYQWYHNGTAVSGANNPTFSLLCTGNPTGSYYVTATSSTGPCPVRSDTVNVVYNPLPDAVIHPRTVQCAGSFPWAVTNVFSGNTFNASYTYTWYLNNTGNQIFTSNTTNYLTYTVNAPGCNVFIVKVTDNTTGCFVYDTACICFSPSPVVTISPSGTLCAGTSQTFTATAGPLSPGMYNYVWQDGTPGQTYTTSLAGVYIATAADKYGCSANAFTMIKPLPYVELFPQGCDTLCDTAHLYFPIPMTNFGSPAYTITWYEGATVIGTGFNIPIIGLGLGPHTIHATVVMNGCTATTANLYLFIKHCVTCDCTGSHWGEIILTNANTGNPVTLKCNSPVTILCKTAYSINATFICKDSSCPGKVTYSLQPPSGAPITGNAPLNFTPAQVGVYILTLYGWCGDKRCDSCTIDIIVKCDSCDCTGSHWGEILYNAGGGPKNIVCGKEYTAKCKTPFTVNASYNCAKPNCQGSVTYILTPPSGMPVSGSVPLTYTPAVSGTYTLVLYGWCGNKKCDSCMVHFKVDCPVDTACCKYEIKGQAGTVSYSLTPSGNGTIAGQNFTFTGLATATLTEVRAEVLSYDLSSNFNNECLGCKTFPFTWASISSAGNIGSVPPRITLFGGATTSLFMPTGAAVYQNPREVIWNNGTTFSVSSPIGIKFILPPPPVIDCCELKGRICVKFTFRDDQCRECEVIICFEVEIKKK